jgi:hypothetical protein
LEVTGTSELCLACLFWPEYRHHRPSDALEEVPVTFTA